MRARSGIAALAVVVALGLTVPAASEPAQKPWEFFKELLGRSPVKGKKATGKTASRENPPVGETAGGVRPSAKSETPSASLAANPPIPRKRPLHGADLAEASEDHPIPVATRDFDAAFVPPQVLKLPSASRTATAEPADMPEPAATSGTEPEPILVGRPGASSSAAAKFPFPVPRARPSHATVAPLAMLPDDEAPAPAVTRPAPISGCVTSLAGLGVDATPLAPVEEGACRVAAPTSITSFENGAVELPIKALVDCQMAATTAHWLKDSVQPAATAELGARVTALRVAGSYDCRSRNHVAGAKLSEHAFGNAIDFGAFRVNGRWIEVGGAHEAAELRFIERIRGEACGPFKTVLGPGSDSYHTDHLHLDLAERRTAGPSKGLYCK